jgi:hypothetical protein
VDVNSPTVVLPSADVKHLTVGGDYVLLIKQDNTLWTWGNNDKGQMPHDPQYAVGAVTNTMTWGSQNSANPTFTAVIDKTKAPAVYVPKEGDFQNYAADFSTIAAEVLTTVPNVSRYSGVTISSKLATYDYYTNTLAKELEKISSRSNRVRTKSGQQGVVENGVVKVNPIAVMGSGTPNYNTDGEVVSTSWLDGTSYHATSNMYWEEAPILCVPYYIAKITDIQAGGKHGYYNLNGKYYSFGDDSLKQQSNDYVTGGQVSQAATINSFISNLSEGFSSLIVAGDTNYIISNTGNAYAWGSNAQGKAGIGSAVASVAEPTKINALNGKAVLDIVKGRNHIGDSRN